jgi:MerR family copper efflux transcriptional regulator
MRIGQLAEHADVSIQTLRYYERRGLLAAPARKASGFRLYGEDAIERVRFIRRAQDLGFTLQEIGDLLALWGDSEKSCGIVERRASAALERIDGKLLDLKRMRRGLSLYINACNRRQPLEECPLLSALGGTEVGPPEGVSIVKTPVSVDLIYDRDCPNIDPCRSAIHRALVAVGERPIWNEWRRDGDDTPEAFRAFGSPTVLIDGRDFFNTRESSADAPQANSCRVYPSDGGFVGAPTVRMLIDALTRGNTK